MDFSQIPIIIYSGAAAAIIGILVKEVFEYKKRKDKKRKEQDGKYLFVGDDM